ALFLHNFNRLQTGALKGGGAARGYDSFSNFYASSNTPGGGAAAARQLRDVMNRSAQGTSLAGVGPAGFGGGVPAGGGWGSVAGFAGQEAMGMAPSWARTVWRGAQIGRAAFTGAAAAEGGEAAEGGLAAAGLGVGGALLGGGAAATIIAGIVATVK